MLFPDWKKWFPDIAIGLFLASLAFISCYYYTKIHYVYDTYFYNIFYPCTNQFGKIPDIVRLNEIQAWKDFEQKKSDRISCDTFKDVSLDEANLRFMEQRYFHFTLSMAFKWFGPCLSSYVFYWSFMYAVIAFLLYVLFRFGMGRIVASGCTLVVFLSPAYIYNSTNPVDFCKTPLFYLCLVGMAVLIRYRLPGWRLYGVSFALGLAVGFGIGFKPDLYAMLPAATVILFVFLPRCEGRGWRAKLLAFLMLTIGVGFVGFPLIYKQFLSKFGSALPIQILGGLSIHEDNRLWHSVLYDYGMRMDDTYAHLIINSYNHRILGRGDISHLYSKGLEDGALQIILRYYKNFPADPILQWYMAVIKILQINRFGFYAALAVFAILFARDYRIAFALLFLLFYICGYVSLIFFHRHYIHLEFISWWFTGCLVHHTVVYCMRLYREKTDFPKMLFYEYLMFRYKKSFFFSRQAAIGAACGVGVLFVLFALLFGLRLIQNANLQVLFDRYDRANMVPQTMVCQNLDDHRVLVRGEEWETCHVYSSANSNELYVTSYLLAEFYSDVPKTVEVTLAYDPPHDYWDQTLRVECSGERGISKLYYPLFELRPRVMFKGIILNGEDLPVLKTIGLVTDLERYPLLPILNLPGDWRERNLNPVPKLGVLLPGDLWGALRTRYYGCREFFRRPIENGQS